MRNITVKPGIPALFAVACLALWAAPSHAATLFLQSPPNGNSYDITDYRLADSFTLSGQSLVNDISFWFQAQQATDLSAVTYAIYADNSGTLGASLQSETINSPNTSYDAVSGLFTADFQITPLLLQANTPYWLELHAGATLTDTSGFTVSWGAVDDNANPIALSLGTSNTPVNISGFEQYAFQLDGAAVPEPGTWLLCAFGTGLVALLARKTSTPETRKPMKQTWILYLAFSAVAVLPAAAQTTWVGSTGIDSGACGARTSPCATFQRAYNNASTGGVVKAMDAGEYGPLNISHAITIDGSGVANITAQGTSTGIYISAGQYDQINLYGFSVHVTGAGTGILVQNAAQIVVADLSISGVPYIGLQTNAGFSSVPGTIAIERLKVVGATYGVSVGGFNGTIRDSVIANNSIGIFSTGTSVYNAYSVNLMVERCQIAFNGAGLISDATFSGAIARVSNSIFVGNTTGITQNSGGIVISYRTNAFVDNTTDGTPSVSTSLK